MRMTSDEFWTRDRNRASLVANVATSSFTDATLRTRTSITIATAMKAAALRRFRAPVCDRKMMQATPMMTAGTLPSGSVLRILAAGPPRYTSGCGARAGCPRRNVARRVFNVGLYLRCVKEGGKRLDGVGNHAPAARGSTRRRSKTGRAALPRANLHGTTRREPTCHAKSRIWFGLSSGLYWAGSARPSPDDAA